MATHRVSKGNSLAGLAQLYYRDAKAEAGLAAANQLRTGAALKPGATLRLPPRLVHLDTIAERRAMSTAAVMGIFDLRSDLVFVKVREEWFGEQANTVGALSGKWLYVVSDGSIVATAEIPLEGEWQVENDLFDAQRFASDETLVLIAGHDYRFLVSPYKLSPNAQSRFVQRSAGFWNSERQAGKPDVAQHIEWTILVRDAYQWALDVHHLLYMPRLEAYRKYVADNADKLFIASTLKCLIEARASSWTGEHGDPLSLADDLRPGEPDNYITNVYLKGLDVLRIAAERAAARVAALVYSEEHLTLEISSMDDGKAALEVTTLMWANVLEFLNETLPGRKLLHWLAQDAERFPVKYLLTSTPPANAQISEFSRSRYLANAAIAVLKDMAPAWLQLHNLSHRRKLEQFAAFISAAAGQKVDLVEKSFSRMHENLVKGVWLGTDVQFRKTTRLLLEGTSGFNEAAKALKDFRPPSESLVKSAKLGDALARKPALIGFRFGLEIFNFSVAYGEWQSDHGARKTIGMAGAAADLSALMVDVGLTFVKQLERSMTRYVGAGLGIVSGICDSYEFGASSLEATDRHDYDAAVGLGIATAGAGMITVGSTLSLYKTYFAGVATVESHAAAGTLMGEAAITAVGVGLSGSAVMILGAALVAGGSVWWLLATDTSYEEFAKYCFLGTFPEERVKPSWTSIQFPPADSQEELRALTHVISGFRVTLERQSGLFSSIIPFRLKLEPGVYGENDVFDVYFEHPLRSGDDRRLAARLTVHIASGGVWQQSGDLMAPDVDVERGENGRVESIHLSEAYADLRHGAGEEIAGRIARVRLRSDSGTIVPHDGTWVGVKRLGVQESDRPVAESADPNSRIDTHKSPFAVMKAL